MIYVIAMAVNPKVIFYQLFSSFIKLDWYVYQNNVLLFKIHSVL